MRYRLDSLPVLVLVLLACLHTAAISSRPTWLGVEIQGFAQAPADPRIIYAAGKTGLFKSTDRGSSWRPLKVPTPVTSGSIHVNPDDAQHVLALVAPVITPENATLLESRNGGASWVVRHSLQPLEAPAALTPVALKLDPLVHGGAWWAVAGTDLYRSPDQGHTWLKNAPASSRQIVMVHGEQWTYRLEGLTLWRSGDRGQTWSLIYTMAAPSIRRGSSPANLLALPGRRVLLRNADGNWLESPDDGQSWAAASTPWQPLNRKPAGSTTGPFERFTTWCRIGQSPAAPSFLLATCISDDGALPSRPSFARSSDAGQTWTPLAPQTPGCAPQCLPGSWYSTATLFDAQDPDRLLLGWMAGGVYRTEDGGQTWKTSGEGLMFRNRDGEWMDWVAIHEPPLVRAVLYRDEALLEATLQQGEDIQAPGHHLGGVLAADLAVLVEKNRHRLPATGSMYARLRSLGAQPKADTDPPSQLFIQAVRSGRTDIAQDLVRAGYDWGFHRPGLHEQSELREALGQQDPPSALLLGQPLVRWMEAYLEAARFPSADQTVLDLFSLEQPDLALKVLKASTRRHPFDRQSTPPSGRLMELVQRLALHGHFDWARRVYLQILSTPARTETASWDERLERLKNARQERLALARQLREQCAVRELDWFRARGLGEADGEDVLALRCLNNRALGRRSRYRILQWIKAHPSIAPHGWAGLADDSDTAWIKRTRLYRQLQARLEAQAGLIGIQFEKTDGEPLRITQVVPGFPAAQSGLRAGDQIVQVGAQDTRSLSQTEIIQRIRGRPGTQASIVVQRDRREWPLRLTRKKAQDFP